MEVINGLIIVLSPIAASYQPASVGASSCLR